MIRKSTGSLLLMLALPTLAHAVEILRWERIPLAIPLTVGQERIVFVDRNVRVGVPRDLQGKLRVQSTGGALYLLANEPIPPARLRLQDATNGEQMLIDIAATEATADQQPREPVRIVAGEPVAPHYGQSREAQPSAAAKQTEHAEAPKAVPRETPVPVVLTRYAAQMLYAPLRTVEPVDGVGQVRVKRQLDLTTLLPSLPITATALGAWRLDDYYITAVKLQNASAQHLALDPRDLMGNFIAATFQHPYLGPRGDASDTTTVYLVTRGRGLADALLPSSISQIDPKGGRRGADR